MAGKAIPRHMLRMLSAHLGRANVRTLSDIAQRGLEQAAADFLRLNAMGEPVADVVQAQRAALEKLVTLLGAMKAADS